MQLTAENSKFHFNQNFCEKACYIEKKGVVSNAMESQSFNICTLLLFNLPPDGAFTEISPALVTILALFMHVYLFSGTFWKCLDDFDQEHPCCLQWIQLSFQVFSRKEVGIDDKSVKFCQMLVNFEFWNGKFCHFLSKHSMQSWF